MFDIKLVFHEIVIPELLTEPKTTYELELGKEKELDLGKYQADSAIVFTSYEVSSTSQGSSEDITNNLADIFLVQAQHKNEKISLMCRLGVYQYLESSKIIENTSVVSKRDR